MDNENKSAEHELRESLNHSGWYIFCQFSVENQRTQGNIWTTISTYLSIRRILWNLCGLDDEDDDDDDYCSAIHFEFKDSPECLQCIQTSEHLGHGLARSCMRILRCISTTMVHTSTLHELLDLCSLYPLRYVHTMPCGTQRQSAARLRGKSCAMPQVYVDVASAWLWHTVRCCVA